MSSLPPPACAYTLAIEASSAITRTFLCVARKVWWISPSEASGRGTRITSVLTHLWLIRLSFWQNRSTSMRYWPCSLPREENSMNRGRQSPRKVRANE